MPFRLLGALPCVAEQPRLVVGGQQRRLADVQLRAAETGDGRDQGVEDALGGHDQQVHRTVIPLRQRHDARQQPALGGGGLGMSGAVVLDVHAEQPGGHDDDVAIACGLKRRGDVRERMRVAHGDQHVAGPRLDLPDRELGRRQQLEGVQVFGADVGFRQPWAERQHEHERRQRSAHVAIAGGSPIATSASSAADATRGDEDEARGHPQPAEPDVERHAIRARARHARPQAHERREPDEQRHPDADGVGVRDPRHAAAAREHDDDRRRGGEIGRVCVGAEPRMLQREPLGQPVRGCEAPQQALRVRKRRVGGGSSSSTAVTAIRIPAMPRAQGGPARCWPRPASGVANHNACALDGTSSAYRNASGTATASVKIETIVPVRRSAWIRGGWYSCAPRASASPPPEQRDRNREGDEHGQGGVGEPPAGAARGPARRPARPHRAGYGGARP